MNEPARNLSESPTAARNPAPEAARGGAQPDLEGKAAAGGAKVETKAMVGRKSSVHRYDATEESLRRFCQAIGGRYRGEAPPTFMTIFRVGEFEILKQMSIPLQSVLHADQEYRYEAPILAGDPIEYQTVLTRAFEKTGSSGSMRFFVFDTEVRALRAEGPVVVGGSKTTLIVR